MLEDLQLLNEHFNSNPLIQQRYKERENERQKHVKGIYPSPQRHLEIETEIDILTIPSAFWISCPMVLVSFRQQSR